MFERQSFVWGFLFCTLIGLPLLYLGSCADDLTGATGASGQDAAATPNVSIRGGGTITWSTENDQVSFTEDIVIRDHARGSVYTITPSASPITLANTGDISYVELIRESAAEETITDTTEVQSGSIELEGGNSVAVTLFERPETDVIYIPWVQKELVTGDEWRFGTALSLYENLASKSKPRYFSNDPNGEIVTVPGAASAPAVVRIAGKIHANLEAATANLSGEGPDGDGIGGLEPGDTWTSNMPYYLYAIPSASGRSFEIVGAENPPTEGPDEFDKWSYVGACATYEGSAELPYFEASNGWVQSQNTINSADLASPAVTYTPRPMNNMPLTITKGYFNLRLDPDSSGVGVGESVFIKGFGDGGSSYSAISQANGHDAFANVWIPIDTPGTIYLYITDTNVTNRTAFLGWQEDPMAYK